MNAVELDRVKNSIVKELDGTFRRYYHQRLEDVINDLHLHSIETKPDPSADEVIAMIWENRILHLASAQQVVELRGTLERWCHGTFGFCTVCGKEISAELLERHPSTSQCIHCQHKTPED